MAPKTKPYQLMEISIMSAQDLEPVSRKMKTYAIAWTNSKRKLATKIDTKGGNNPTWNDKFVFKVDEEFLLCETSGITVEIYSTHWFRDVIVGTVHVLVGNLVPPPRPFHNSFSMPMKCVALQVRRPSGRTQGILNIGVSILDSTMRSMPLYKEMNGSAVGFRDLVGMDDEISQLDLGYNNNNNQKPMLFRSRSEKSSMFDGSSIANSLIMAPPPPPGYRMGKSGSVVSGSDFGGPIMGNSKKGKSSSVVSGSDFGGSIIGNPKMRKSSSVVSGSDFGGSMIGNPKKGKGGSIVSGVELKKSNSKGKKNKGGSVVSNSNVGYDDKSSMAGYIFRPPPKPYSMLSGSEVGPSASEVAGMMRRYPLEDDKSSMILDEWTYDDTDEGLRSKLDRWRSEMPGVYDTSSSIVTYRKDHDNGEESGLFSIIGNICGYECQCVCGTPPAPKPAKSKSRRRLRSSMSIGSSSSVSF